MELQVKKTIELNSPFEMVWEALTTSEWTRKYMFGSEVISDWKVGSDLLWKGEYEGQPFIMKGKIFDINPPYKLSYSFFDPAIGLEDKEENYLEVTNELKKTDRGTLLTVITKNFLGNETRRDHSEQAWEVALSNLKTALESKSST